MDATNLYMASSTSTGSGRIYVAAKEGASATTLLELPSMRPFGVAFDDAHDVLFFGNRGVGLRPSRIGYTSTTSPAEMTLGSAEVKFFGGIAVTPDAVLATASDTGWLVRVARSDGAATILANGFKNPIDVIVDGNEAYVVDAGREFEAQPGSITRVPIVGGGAKFPLAEGLSNPYGIAIDADYVYFTTLGTSTNTYYDGSVMRVPKAGGRPLPLAINQSHPRGIQVDANFVYWVTSGTPFNPFGAVVRTPR